MEKQRTDLAAAREKQHEEVSFALFFIALVLTVQEKNALLARLEDVQVRNLDRLDRQREEYEKKLNAVEGELSKARTENDARKVRPHLFNCKNCLICLFFFMDIRSAAHHGPAPNESEIFIPSAHYPLQASQARIYEFLKQYKEETLEREEEHKKVSFVNFQSLYPLPSSTYLLAYIPPLSLSLSRSIFSLTLSLLLCLSFSPSLSLSDCQPILLSPLSSIFSPFCSSKAVSHPLRNSRKSNQITPLPSKKHWKRKSGTWKRLRRSLSP